MTDRLTPEREAEIAALRRFADLMDEDDARTGRVGIPASYGHHLLRLAVDGLPGEAWDREWARIAHSKSVAAATAWAEQQEQQTQRLIDLVYPGGATARARSAAVVRAMADAMAETVVAR